jgi:hypothetical protein
MPIHDWTRVAAGTFHDFHNSWITHLKETLNEGVLPHGYYAMSEQHAGRMVANILTLKVDPPAPESSSSTGTSGTAVAEAPARVGRRIVASEAAAYRELRRTLAIRHVSDHRLVAMIEIISPGNKDRVASVAEFVDKARAALRAGCHLLVIDLFPPGNHDPSGMHEAIWEAYRDSEDDFVAVPRPALLASYVATRPPEAYVECVHLGTPLPEMALFLETSRYVDVPLESTYQAAYRGMPEVWRNVLEAS